MINVEVLQHESHIVWLEPAESFEFVHQREVATPDRVGRPAWFTKSMKLVGYAVLRDGSPTHPPLFPPPDAPYFLRRAFFVASAGKPPTSLLGPSIDPCTVQPGQMGVLVPRRADQAGPKE
jgi:Family of unknown function (DUF6009)